MGPIRLVGRGDELAELRRAWDRVAGGVVRPGVAVITGPAGSGKSRLVAEFRPPGAPVLHGAARVHSPAPYDWLAALLSRPLPGAAVDERLEACVPAAAQAWLRQDVDVPGERYAPDALLRIAVRVVRVLIGPDPAVLVVEDLHALDPASLNLVAALAIADLPALLVVTARPSTAPLVTATLARLTGTDGAIRQHLAPLDRTDVAEALTAAYGEVTPAAADAAWRRSGGNPRDLAELIAEARTATDLVPAQRDSGDDAADLTARELDVLGCLTEGLTNQQVASRLGISVRTVTVHVSNLLRKTRSRSRTDAALWAIRHRVPTGSG